MHKVNNYIRVSDAGHQIAGSEEFYLPKILIVDDEPRVLRSLQAAFKFKFDVTVAQNAFQAMGIMEDSERFDVIVSDERMPKCPGHDLLKWVKDNHPYCIRILLTSSDFHTVQDSIKSADVYKFLTKPWNTREFEAVLEQAAQKSQELVSQVLEEQLSDLSQQCILAVLDHDKTYRKSYQTLERDIDGITDTYFFDSTEEIYASMSHIEGIGILLIDLSIGSTNAENLIRVVNDKNESVSIIVTSEPASVRRFISENESLDYQYITKPMSLQRLQPIVSGAVEKFTGTPITNKTFSS